MCVKVNPLVAFVLIIGLIVPSIGYAGYKGPPTPPKSQRSEPDFRFIQYTLPAGSAFQVLLQTPLNTESSQLNDPVEAIMDHDLYLGNEHILRKNTRFKGYIAQLEPPIQGSNAILYVLFNEIDTDNGDRLPIAAHIRTGRKDHKWGGELTKGSIPLMSTQRVYEIGEYNRTVYGGPRVMGEQVNIPPGEHLTIILDQPLNLLKPKTEP